VAPGSRGDPRRRSAIRSLGQTIILAGAVCAAHSVAAHGASKRYWPGPVLAAEGKSQALCESVPNRIFVATTVGSECIAYWATKGNEQRRHAVFFIDGDLPPVADQATFQEHMHKTEDGIEKLMQKWADKLHVRYVYLARPALHRSSGNHKDRMKARETVILAGAAERLEDRLGVDSIALAGQSRGSTIAASLLTLKLHGVNCAVLGSGAFEIVNLEYDVRAKGHQPVDKAALRKIMCDPSAHIDGIEPDATRRIFVIGDREDPKAAFPQQTHFVESLKTAGNHAVQIEVEAYHHHGAARYAVPTAGACLNGLPDNKIVTAVAKMQQEHKQLRVSDSVEDDAEGGPTAQAPVTLDPEDPNTTE
jgi:pimeloyl-ACP methyl ester carboxylesterase